MAVSVLAGVHRPHALFSTSPLFGATDLLSLLSSGLGRFVAFLSASGGCVHPRHVRAAPSSMVPGRCALESFKTVSAPGTRDTTGAA